MRDAWIDKARTVPIDNELARRGHHLRRSGAEQIGPCPICGGHDRFSVNPRKGVWNCRGCGKGGDVIDLVRHFDGCDFEEAVRHLVGDQPKKPNGHARGNGASRLAGTWIYRDADERPYLKVDRWDSAAGEKSYPQSHWDGERWISGKPKGPKIPYRLPELLDSDRSEPVYACEGEKCADAVAGLGLFATSASEGAGKWTADLNEHFRDRIVCILPDHDEPGRKHANKVAQNLHGIAREIRVVDLPGLADSEDAVEWITRGGTREQLDELFDKAPSWMPDGAKEDKPKKEKKRRGRELNLLDPEPWPEPVVGAHLLSDVANALKAYIVLPDGAPEFIALWAAHTYCFDAFDITPRLAITSPTKQCGKTLVLDVIKHLVPRPLLAANVSAAAMFRVIEMARPTMLIDEADTFLSEKEELRGILNAGHRRGEQVVRCDENGNVMTFDTFAPLVIAMIGKPPETVLDRSIECSMTRRKRSEKVASFRSHRVDDLHVLARMLARWAADNVVALKAADPDMGKLENRTADNWRPLFALADLAGAGWGKKIRDIADKVSERSEDKSTLLLSDVRAIFETREADFLESETIVECLLAMKERSWGEYGRRGKPITMAGLARGLKPFNVASEPNTAGSRRGYVLARLHDAFERYL